MRSGIVEEGGGDRSIEPKLKRFGSGRPGAMNTRGSIVGSPEIAGRSGRYGVRNDSATAGPRGATAQQHGAESFAPASSAWQCMPDMPAIPCIAPPAGRIPSQRHPTESEATNPARARTTESEEKREKRATAEVFHGAARSVQATGARRGLSRLPGSEISRGKILCAIFDLSRNR